MALATESGANESPVCPADVAAGFLELPAAHTWDRVLCRAKILLEKIPFDFALVNYFGW